MGCSTSREATDATSGQPPPESGISIKLRLETLTIAGEMFTATKGRRFHEFYTRLTLTSYGASCKVLTAYHRVTGKKVAVKTIPKMQKHLERQRRRVMQEIGTFRLVEDHPNAVRVLEVFEGAECYYVVMECCEGGELFDHISKKGGFTERQAATLLHSLMLFVAHMHGKGIAHLDLKPENVMFDSEGANGVLKVLDFGSAVFVQPHEQVKNAFGTVRYASPEMANDLCGQKADIWSCGVIMYILLSGKAPFLKSNDNETLDFIKSRPKVKFPSAQWGHISQPAKDIIKAMLDPNPETRPTAVAVLQMPWLKQQVPDTIIQADILGHLRSFANQSRIRRLLLGLMADQLVGATANQMLGQFYSLDQDFSGVLEVQELVKAAQQAMPDLTDKEIERMFEALDVDHTGTVDVKEFFAGLLASMDEEKQTMVAQKSFTMMDKRGAGFVTKEAFFEALLERANASTASPSTRAGTMNVSGAGNGPAAVPSALSPRNGTSYSMDTNTSGAAAQAALEAINSKRTSATGGNDMVMLDPTLVAELEAEFAALDANGDGVLSFAEFKAILGIQSTPEGLQLTQSQVTAGPAIQDVESLAQALANARGNSADNIASRNPSAHGGPGRLDVEQATAAIPTKELLNLLQPAIKRTASQRARTHSRRATGTGTPKVGQQGEGDEAGHSPSDDAHASERLISGLAMVNGDRANSSAAAGTAVVAHVGSGVVSHESPLRDGQPLPAEAASAPAPAQPPAGSRGPSLSGAPRMSGAGAGAAAIAAGAFDEVAKLVAEVAEGGGSPRPPGGALVERVHSAKYGVQPAERGAC